MSTKDLHQLGVAELAAQIRSRQVSAVETAQHFLARMQAHEGLGAFLATDPEVTLAQARAADAETAEADAMLGQLNGFFDIVERMRAVDTTGVAPLYTPLSAVQDVALRLRDDAVTEAVDREANQRSAPAVEAGLYLVPRVIE